MSKSTEPAAGLVVSAWPVPVLPRGGDPMRRRLGSARPPAKLVGCTRLRLLGSTGVASTELQAAPQPPSWPWQLRDRVSRESAELV